MANKKNEAMVVWDKQLAEDAKAAALVVAGLGGGQFLSIRGGTLKLGDAVVPNNEMGVIVLANVLENCYYGSEFDPDNPSSPECYAFDFDASTMAPHEAAKKKVNADCKSCLNNAFGSSEKGRGKACKNRVRLACITGGQLINGRFEPTTDPDAIKSAQVAYLGVPPTSIGGWGAYVKGLASGLKRPPWAVYTKIKVVPDAKVQLLVTFELLGPCGANLAGVLTQRSAEAKGAIIFPYPEREEQPKRKGSGKKRRF